MAIDFPNSPSVNDEFTAGSKTWKWDGSAWRLLGDGVFLSIDELTDVTIDTPLSYQGLMYDGTEWVNSSIPSTFLVRNDSGSSILAGTLVSASGAEGSGRINIVPFETTGTENSELRAIGILAQTLTDGQSGEVISFGTLKNLDTRGTVASGLAVGDETWIIGDILYAHPTVAGKLTKVKPQHDFPVAFITVVGNGNGQIVIRVNPGNNHLEWMHDVSTSSPDSGDVLTYNGSLWVNSPGMPSGSITQFAGASAPSGWLSCDGALVSRTTYAALFDVIGTTYGNGDGSTTFALPNMKGRVPVGIDSAQTEFDALGEAGGAKTHTLTTSEMPSHTHTQNAHTHTGSTSTAGSHQHNYNSPYNTSGMGPAGSYGFYFYSYSELTGAAGDHSHSLIIASATPTNQNTGGGAAHNNLQPYIVLNYIIKA